MLLPQRRERPRFGLRQGDAGVRDRQLHHQRHIRLPQCPLRRPTGHILKRGHQRSFAAADCHVDGREWNRRSGWSNGGKRRRHRSLSATGRIFGGEGRRRRSARSPGPQRGHWGFTTLPSLSPVAPSTEGDTSGLRSPSEEWRKSDRLDIPAQQDNPRSQSRRHTVTPAVTKSAARTQLDVGDQPGAFTVLSAKESISAAIAASAAPHSDSPELPTCPTCDLETPATHAQAHAGPHSKIWRAAEDKEFGDLRAVGTFEELGGT